MIRRGSSQRRVALIGLCASAACLAGCGSTVHVGAAGSGSSVGGLDLSTGLPAGAPTAAPTGSSDLGGVGSLPGTSAEPTASAEPTGIPGSGGGGSGATGPVTGSASGTISIGAEYASESGVTEAAKAFGIDLDVGPVQQEEAAMVAYIDTHGGINGSQVKLVAYEDSTSASASDNSQDACATWTQDNHIVAALTLLVEASACLAKAGVVEIQGYNTPTTPLSSGFAQYPLLTSPNGIALDHLAEAFGNNIGNDGFFTSPAHAKVGVVYNDTPTYISAYSDLERTLAAKGIKIAASVQVPPFEDANIGPLESALESAVLRFKAEGITHVLFLDNQTTAAIFFAMNANGQNYYPRYGLQGSDSAAIFAEDVNNNKKILDGTTVVGWTPVYDTFAPSDYETPAAQGCFAIFKHAGLQIPDNANGPAYALLVCDAFRYMTAAFDSGGSNTAQGFVTGRANLARSGWAAAMTFGVEGEPDGVREVRLAAYNDSCGCFKYVGPKVAAVQ